MKRFYIASSLKNSELVNYYSKILEKNGWKHTYNWTKNINDVKNMENLIENAKLEQNAIINSDIVIVLFPAGRGTHIELGMSLALNKKIYLCSNNQIPNIIKLVGTPDENLKEIIKIESKNN